MDTSPVVPVPAKSTFNPCLECGACCAYYRVSFYWAEGNDAAPGGVPVELTEPLNAVLRAMRGTNQTKPCCKALYGDIGRQVYCTVYAQRPSPCREFMPAWRDGQPNERCDRARRQWGLPLLTPEHWLMPDNLSEVA